MEIKILEPVYTITNTKKLNKAYDSPQKRVLVKWNTSKNINTYIKAEIFFKKNINNVRNIWDMEKRSIVYIIEIPTEKGETIFERHQARSSKTMKDTKQQELGSAINPKQNKYKENI